MSVSRLAAKDCLWREIAVRPTLGGRLEALREQRALSQTDVGRRLGRTQTAISYWEDDKRRPNLDDLCALADLYDVTLDWLIRGAEARPSPSPETPQNAKPKASPNPEKKSGNR